VGTHHHLLGLAVDASCPGETPKLEVLAEIVVERLSTQGPSNLNQKSLSNIMSTFDDNVPARILIGYVTSLKQNQHVRLSPTFK